MQGVKGISAFVWLVSLLWTVTACHTVRRRSRASVAPRAVSKQGCIRGRVLSENDKGFAGVIVETTPPTDFVVTDQEGHFAICRKRQARQSGAASQLVNVPPGTYQLLVKKEGFHHQPVSFSYVGTEQNLGRIIVVEKTRPLPSVSQTKPKEQKLDSIGERPGPKEG